MMLNREIKVLILILTVVVFSNCTGNKEKVFSISGSIENLEKEYIILSKIEDVQSKKESFIDTIKVDENGYFNVDKSLETAIYNLKFSDKKVVQIALVEGQHLSIEGKDVSNLNFSGSVDTQLLQDYETFRKESLTRLVYSVRKEISDLKKEKVSEKKIAALRELEIENYNKHLDELTVFIEKNMESSVAIYPTSIRWNGENIESYKAIVSKFKEVHPNLSITKKLERRVGLLLKTAVGSYVSNIKIPTKDGTVIELNNIKKAYTLVDFWASWCPPCRTESSLLNDLYKKYKSKGFEIYGISLDSKKKRWLDALVKDNRVWPNVSNLQGLNAPVAQEYGITALPTNFIIDSEGKIIASNIHGKHLKAFIDGLMN